MYVLSTRRYPKVSQKERTPRRGTMPFAPKLFWGGGNMSHKNENSLYEPYKHGKLLRQWYGRVTKKKCTEKYMFPDSRAAPRSSSCDERSITCKVSWRKAQSLPTARRLGYRYQKPFKDSVADGMSHPQRYSSWLRAVYKRGPVTHNIEPECLSFKKCSAILSRIFSATVASQT